LWHGHLLQRAHLLHRVAGLLQRPVLRRGDVLQRHELRPVEPLHVRIGLVLPGLQQGMLEQRNVHQRFVRWNTGAERNAVHGRRMLRRRMLHRGGQLLQR
jgi:hypothetical protein